MRDRLVVGSVTTSEYLLLIVLSFSTPVRYLALLTFTRRSNEIYIVLEAPELSRPNPEPTCLKITAGRPEVRDGGDHDFEERLDLLPYHFKSSNT